MKVCSGYRGLMLYGIAAGLVSAPALGQTVTVSVEPLNARAQAGETFTFTVWLLTDGGTIDLRAYQLTAPCSLPGGSGGTVDSPALTVDENLEEWVMKRPICLGDPNCGYRTPDAGDCPTFGPRDGYAGQNGWWATTLDGVPHYLGEVTYQISADAAEGEIFTMDLVDPGPEGASFLRGPNQEHLAFTATGTTLEIVVECLGDGECDDGEVCTRDFCEPGHVDADAFGCVNENQPQPYGDIQPAPDPPATFPCDAEEQARAGDGFLTMLDVMCAFNAMNDGAPYAACPCLDVSPCGGDGFVTMLDVMSIFNTMNDPASAPCPDWCP